MLATTGFILISLITLISSTMKNGLRDGLAMMSLAQGFYMALWVCLVVATH
jgi:hypothetical protein